MALRREADGLLDRTGALRLLREYGAPHLSGSYAMQLMTWRDLDIYLEMPSVDVARFAELGSRLIDVLRPRKASFTDHLNFPATEAVAGLYWGIRTAGWKIDLWGVTAAMCAEKLGQCEHISASLQGDARVAALAIKNDVCHDPRYRDSVTSQQVYDAVIDHGVRTTEAFWECWEQMKN